MEIPRLDKMSNRDLIFVLLGLLAVFGLVSSFLVPSAGFKDCTDCTSTLVMTKEGGLSQEIFNLTYWTVSKTADSNNIYNASNGDITYYVTVTELETINGTLRIYGSVKVKNNGEQTAYLGNAVAKLFIKQKNNCFSPAANVLTYDPGITSVETCTLGSSSPHPQSQTISEGIGSGSLTIVDSYGNDPFATSGAYTSGLYPIPGKNEVIFQYSTDFMLQELPINLSDQDRVRDQIMLTFINAGGNGNGICNNIDANADGYNEPGWHQTLAWFPTDSSACNNADMVGKIISTIDTSTIMFYDSFSASPDGTIVSVPDWTIGSSLLKTDGSNTYSANITASGIPGTEHVIGLNSTATCLQSGSTFIRNHAWLEAEDNTVFSESETFSQINFYCGADEHPPNPIGHMCTFTQESYGGLNTTGFEVMDANASFPFSVGNNGGPYTLTLTSAIAVQNFLPQSGTPSYLTSSATDPLLTSAEAFAGEVVALQLNVDLSDTGGMPQTSDEIYGNLRVQNTLTTFDGMQVREVLGIANCLLANGSDCIGYTTANISELNGVLEKLNINYYNCQNDFNYTGPDDDEPPVIVLVEAIPDLLYGGQNYLINVTATDNIQVVKVNITVDGISYDLSPMGNGAWQITINAPSTSGVYIIHVNAYDAVNNSDYDDGTSITVDAGAPLITLLSPLNNTAITPGTILDFSVTDSNLDSVKVNITTGTSAGTTLVDFTSPYDIDTTGWAEGVYTVYIWANDTLGNEAEKSFRFTIDSTNPDVSLDADPKVANNESTVTFTAQVDDENYDSENVYLDCANGEAFSVKMVCTGTSTPYTCTYEWTPVNDGIYTCNVTATDLAGNTGTSNNVEIIIDSTAPHISLNGPAEYSYVQAGTEINITVTNAVYDDLEQVWYSTDGGLTNTTLPNTTDPLYYIPTDGLECEITFDVWASDSAGNIKHEDFVFNLDLYDPVINLVTVSAPSPLWPSMPYNVSVNATDTKMMDGVNVTVNGFEYPLTHSTGDLYYINGLVAPGPGTYPVIVEAFDMSGRTVIDNAQSITVTLPPGPVIVLHSPANGDTIKNTVPILVNITNSTTYQVDTALFNSSYDAMLGPFDSVNGNQYAIDVSGYPDGTYVFYVFANDTGGVSSTATYTFTIDSTAPIVANLTITPNIFSSGTSVTFTADVHENLGLAYNNKIWFRCQNSTGTWMPWFKSSECTGTLPNLECSRTIPISYADGIYQCKAYAWDKAGNSASSAFAPMTIDSTAPVITLNSPLPAGSTITSGTIINLSVANGVYDSLDTVQYQVDGGTWMELVSPFDIDTTGYPDGEHCFNVTANDTAGNTNTVSFCYKFDNTAPVIHSVVPNPDYFAGGGPFDIKVNVTDMPFPADFETTGTVELFAGTNPYNLTFNSSSGLWEGYGLDYAPPPEACGIVYLTVVATDEAGNSATDTDTPLNIIGCNPVIILLSPSDGATISAGTMIDTIISHPFPVTANYSVDGGGKIPFASPYDISTIGWAPGTHTVFIEAADEYGYYSNATFTFIVSSPGPGPDGDKPLSVAMSTKCPENEVTFTTTHLGNGISGVTVRLVIFDPMANVIGQKETDSSGKAAFLLSSAGQYSAYISKSGYKYSNNPYEFTYVMCPPVIPPCDDDLDCPGGEVCVEGECKPKPPECDDDLDCPVGQVCINGNCQPVPPECDEDSDCALGEICVNGECVPEPPECQSNSDCPEGYVCDNGVCEGVPGIDGQPPDGTITEPGETIVLDFVISNNGTAPITNVNLLIGDLGEAGEVLGTGPAIPVLNPGESATISATIKIGENTLPGDYSFPVTYGSDEVSLSKTFSFSVVEEVVPGILFEDAALCLLPLLLLLLLLALLLLLKKKVVMDGEAFKGLAGAKKLNLLEDYFVPDTAFLRLTPKLRKKCKGVKVKASVASALAKKHKLSAEDATLVAVAIDIKASKIITTSKGFLKLSRLRKKLEGIEFFSLESILAPKK